MKTYFTFLFFLTSTITFGQKTVNDSTEFARQNKYFSLQINKLQLPELIKTKEDFYFRLSYHGTKIDIWKDSTDNIDGILTKYVFSQERNTKKRDTIFKKYSVQNSKEVFNLINESKILEIPSQKEIKNWRNGLDGITYTFEFANKKNYQIKSYWTPSAQDTTILEVQKLEFFFQKINSLVKLDSINKSFEADLLPGFSYNNGSIISFIKVELTNSNVYFDFSGNYRLPLGFTFGYYVNKIKSKNIRIESKFNIQSDLNNNLHYNSSVTKLRIFGNDKTYYDSFSLIHEYNKLNYIKTFPKFEIFKTNYSGNINKYICFGLEFNQLKSDKIYNGLTFSLSKNFESINLTPYYDLAIYENKITNYIIGIQKSFKLKTENKIYYIPVNLSFEKTFDFKNLNLSLYIPIKSWKIN